MQITGISHDPRGVFIARVMEAHGETNVCHAFCRALVR
jgi:hypothetical protein